MPVPSFPLSHDSRGKRAVGGRLVGLCPTRGAGEAEVDALYARREAAGHRGTATASASWRRCRRRAARGDARAERQMRLTRVSGKKEAWAR
jgi:hypothetical protein